MLNKSKENNMSKKNNINDISNDNLYELLRKAKKSPTQYVAQIQAIEKELRKRQSIDR